MDKIPDRSQEGLKRKGSYFFFSLSHLEKHGGQRAEAGQFAFKLRKQRELNANPKVSLLISINQI